jgi:anti-sigma factor RsiW
MSIFGSRNKHPQRDLPAYADGESSPSQSERIERHLAECVACSEELADLRALSATLRGLPEVSPPRSFALTPSQVTRSAPAPERGLPAWAAMRIVGTGVAAVFALVIMLDAGGVIEDNRSEESAVIARRAGGGDFSQDSLESTVMESPVLDAAPIQDSGLEAAPTSAPAAGQDGGIAGAAPGADGDDGAAPPPDPDEAAPPNEYSLDATPPLTSVAASGENSNGEEYRDASANVVTDGDGDGPDALLLIEIVLGVVAALAIGGSFLISRTRQRI